MTDEHFIILSHLITQARRAKFLGMAKYLQSALIVGRREYLKTIRGEDHPSAITRLDRKVS